MKNLFALVGAATITFVGLGWYMGWYHLSRQPSISGTQRFDLEVSPQKIATDGKDFIEKVGDVANRLSEDNGKSDPQPPSTAPAGTGQQTRTPPPAR